MALKDDILNNYFKAPLSKKKKDQVDKNEPLEFSLSKRHRFSDRDESMAPNDIKPALEVENKKYLNSQAQDFSIELTSSKKTAILNNKFETSTGVPLPLNNMLKKNYETSKGFNTARDFSLMNVRVQGLRELEFMIKKIRGLQKDILLYILEKCCNSGTLDSGPIDLNELEKEYNSSLLSIRTALKRLINKKLIIRGAGKRGNMGYSVFFIPREVKEITLNIYSKTY